MVIEVSLVHKKKVHVFIFLMLFGMFIEVRLKQLAKAFSPISSTLSGILTDVKPVNL